MAFNFHILILKELFSIESASGTNTVTNYSNPNLIYSNL